MIRQWDKDAFWETPKKTVLNCISEQEEGNKKIRQVHKLVEADPLFKECVDALTPEHIDENTKQRIARKFEEQKKQKEQKAVEERQKETERESLDI